MDVIFTAFGMLAFMVGAVYVGYTVMKKSGVLDEKRPVTSETKSEIFDTLKNIGNKIPGFSEEDRELSKKEGTWYTTAEFPQTWEYILRNLGKSKMIFRDPKYAWKRIEDNLPYKTITLSAGWDEREKFSAPLPNAPEAPPITIVTTVNLELSFEPLPAGGTAIHFKYDVIQTPCARLMPPIVKETNMRLKQWCLNLSQDPNRGSVI